MKSTEEINRWSCAAVAVLIVVVIALIIVIMLMIGAPPFTLGVK